MAEGAIEAHDIRTRLEAAIREVARPITIHVEPDWKARHEGVLVL